MASLSMASTSKKETHIFRGIELVVALLVILFILSFTWKIPIHVYQLWAMQRDFRSSMAPMHPPESYLNAEVKEFGLFGDSNHCDYFVGEFRTSPLSKEKIRQTYASVITSAFVGNRLLETDVYFTDEDIFAHYPWSEWLEKYLPDYYPVADPQTYLIFSEDAGNSPDGDIRCH